MQRHNLHRIGERHAGPNLVSFEILLRSTTETASAFLVQEHTCELDRRVSEPLFRAHNILPRVYRK